MSMSTPAPPPPPPNPGKCQEAQKVRDKCYSPQYYQYYQPTHATHYFQYFYCPEKSRTICKSTKAGDCWCGGVVTVVIELAPAELQYFWKNLDSTKSYRIDAVVLNTTGAGQRRYFQKKAWNVISTNPALPPSVMSGKKSICSPTQNRPHQYLR